MNNAAKNVHFKRNIINPRFRLPGSSGKEGEWGEWVRVITWEGLDGDLAGLFEKGTFRLGEELIYFRFSDYFGIGQIRITIIVGHRGVMVYAFYIEFGGYVRASH